MIPQSTSRLSVAGLFFSVALLGACGTKPDTGAANAPTPGSAAPIAATSAGSSTSSAPVTPSAAPASIPTASKPAGPPVSVTTVAASQRDLAINFDAMGTVVPMRSVEIKPQVSSVVSQVHVREGQFVKAGELLFTLDARSDQANVAKLQAQQAKSEVALADAKRQLARSRELQSRNFVSQGGVDANQTLVDSQVAAVAADKAAIDAARVALSYSRITAPHAGRAGAINLYPGSAVQANQTPLVTITQLDPIEVSFSLPQRHLKDVLTALKNGNTRVDIRQPDSNETLSGQLQFVDNAVDVSTGTVKIKARFGNKEAKLWPGISLPVSLTANTIKSAVVIPQAAIIQSTRGTMVYVVKEGKAERRPVKVLATQGEEAAVTGVKPDERLVLDGKQNVRPDASVVEKSADASGKSGKSSATDSTEKGGTQGKPDKGPTDKPASAADGKSASTPGKNAAAS